MMTTVLRRRNVYLLGCIQSVLLRNLLSHQHSVEPRCLQYSRRRRRRRRRRRLHLCHRLTRLPHNRHRRRRPHRRRRRMKPR